MISSSLLVVDERDHDLEVRRLAAVRSRTAAAARDDRLDLHLVDLGVRDPEPARRACRASGSSSRDVLDAVERAARARSRSSDSSIRARSTSAASSGRFGRNSCSGGSSSRIVTGRPAIASKRPSKSSCWSGSSSASASRRSSVAVGHDHRPHLGLAVVGHEHVLGAAQADALGAELARLLRRPRGRRRWRARRAGGSRRPTRARGRSARRPRGRRAGRRRWSASPVVPSIAIMSPSRDRRPVDGDRPARRGRCSARTRRPRPGAPSRGRPARRATPCRPRR